jgi:hypothetical protein
MHNQSTTHKADYKSWAPQFSLGGDIATVSDDFGNNYKRLDFGLSEPVGRLENGSIYPNGDLSDILVFELPADNAKTLTVTFPRGNIDGSDGESKVQFSVNNIFPR